MWNLGRLGDPVYYADATSEEALGHAHVETCRAIVIMINDNQAIERVISTIARMKVKHLFLSALNTCVGPNS
jgi:voltage-gated potassium channel Kch